MRLSTATSCLALALPLIALANQDSKVSRLSALAKANAGLLHLDDRLYDELTSLPRNYSIAIVFTAMGSQFNCRTCVELEPEYRLLAKQWQKQPAHLKDTHFFGLMDYSRGEQTFRKLGITSAPQCKLYLPTMGPRHQPSSVPTTELLTYDFTRAGLSAEAFAATLNKTLFVPNYFERPPDYVKITIASVATIGFVVLVFTAWPFVSLIIGNRYVWAIITMPFLLAMCSGYMWNQIRSPQWAATDQNGRISYFAGGMSNQYGIETQIVSGVYGVLAFSAYTLVSTVPKLENAARQRLAVYIWLGVFMMTASAVLGMFRQKHGGYPYKLFI